jgi:ubiquinone/menaquinone biosynthesis C-methylase UbiE
VDDPAAPSDRPITFDRAADYYDRTRALPPDVMEGVVELLEGELAGRGTTLELGVGTGRIALPLHERGVDLIGLDISSQMIEKLIETAGSIPFRLLLADATRLPFTANSLNAAVVAHDLHLISEWRIALDELTRVLDRGSLLLVDLGRWGTGKLQEITEFWSREAGLEAKHPGIIDRELLDDEMKARGARTRELEQISGSRTITYETAISQYEEGLWSFTWRASEAARRKAAEKTRRWVRENFGPLDGPFEEEVVVRWRAYDF